MTLLLDTHVALWWLDEPERLAADARRRIADRSGQVFVSAASVWEVAIKEAGRGLELPSPFMETAESAGLLELPIRSRHAVRAGALPLHHRDPFDRMLVAQALDEGLVLVTRDPLIRRYDVPTLLA